MKVNFILFAFLCLLITQTIQQKQTETKTQELRRLALQSENGVINLNGQTYKKYIEETPRPYDTVIFYSANSCKFCDIILGEYKQAATFYRDSGALYPSNVNDEKKRAVFFFLIYYNEQSHEIFTSMNFNSIPNIAVLPPKVAHMSKAEKQMTLKSLSWQISYTDGHVTSHKLLEFINKRTNRDVTYKESVLNILFVLSLVVVIGFGFYYLFMKFRPFFLNSKLWLVGSIVIYFVCMSGFIYNIIHDIPMTSTDKKGNLQWMATSEGRAQLGAEGYIMSFSITLSGILIFLSLKIFKWSNPDVISRIIFILILVLAYHLIGFVESVYGDKSHYKIRFWPPSTYIQGPLMKDQGNTL